MPDKCLDCPAPSADMDGFIVSGPGGAPRSEGSGVSSPEGPFVREAPQTGHVVIMGTLGADGNPGSLPDAPQVGWAYVAEDAGTYGGVQATEGDVVYCMSLNPVKWGVLQADSDDSGRDLVSVSASFGCDPSPVLTLSSVKADGTSSSQEVDMSCLSGMYGRLDSLSASFECGGRTWYLSSCEVTGDTEDPNEYVEHAVSAASLDGPLSVDLSPSYRWESGLYDGFRRSFILSTVPVDMLTCEVETPLGLVYVAGCFVAEGYEDTPPEDVAVFVISVDFGPYSVPGDGESVDVPVLAARKLLVSGIGVSDAMYAHCDLRGRYVAYSGYSSSASPVLLSVEGTGSGMAGILHAAKNPAFDWSQYESGAKLTLASTSASGVETVQEVDMSCLVPPVFDGTENGLVPASGAVQNYLLAGNGSWMRPMTDAEIDALFA